MDYEHIFDQLDIDPDPFAICELEGQCDLGLGRAAAATLHYILSGSGELMIKGKPPIPVEEGTLILVPALQSHSLRSHGRQGDPLPKCKPAELHLQHLRHGNDEAPGGVLALCAHVRVGLRGAVDIIDLIRSPFAEKIAPGDRMCHMVQTLVSELSNPNLGSRAMIRAVLTQCMIELLRRRLRANDSQLLWMAALKDPAIWEALRAMLEDPGAAHTVESLADSVGMSRSTFAQRFAEAYGSGPIDLLRELRLFKAGVMLRDSNAPVKSIAHAVGFSSRTAFSRMFEKKTGVSPSDYRVQSRQGPDSE